MTPSPRAATPCTGGAGEPGAPRGPATGREPGPHKGSVSPVVAAGGLPRSRLAPRSHQRQQQARHGGEGHVRPAGASHSPIGTRATEAAAVEARDERLSPARAQVQPGAGRTWVGECRLEWRPRPGLRVLEPNARTGAPSRELGELSAGEREEVGGEG